MRLPVAGRVPYGDHEFGRREPGSGLGAGSIRDHPGAGVLNVDALPHHQPDQFRDLLTRQVVCPVMWEDTVRALIASGVDRCLEIGSGRVLTGTVKRIHRKTTCDNFGD